MSDREPLVVGVDVGGTKIAAGLLRLRNGTRPEILSTAKVTHMGIESAVGLFDHVEGIARTAVMRAGIDLADCACVGVGFPGQVDRRAGVLKFLPGLRLRNIDAKAELERRLGCPVHVENDVRCTTLAELRYGAGLTYADFVCVWVGTGIGSGIVINHRVLSGHTHSAGEIGHMTLDMSSAARPCTCGSYGCFEEYCSGRALSAAARVMIREEQFDGPRSELRQYDVERIVPEDIAHLAKKGDPVAIELAAQIAHYLGIGLATVANVLNPEAIVLGGGMIDGFFGFPFFRERVSNGFCEHALDVCRSTQVLTSQLGHAPIIGAASLATPSP